MKSLLLIVALLMWSPFGATAATVHADRAVLVESTVQSTTVHAPDAADAEARPVQAKAEKPRCPGCPKRQKAGHCATDCPPSAGLPVPCCGPAAAGPGQEPPAAPHPLVSRALEPELPPPRG